jgi:hypothetical protein
MGELQQMVEGFVVFVGLLQCHCAKAMRVWHVAVRRSGPLLASQCFGLDRWSELCARQFTQVMGAAGYELPLSLLVELTRHLRSLAPVAGALINT